MALSIDGTVGFFKQYSRISFLSPLATFSFKEAAFITYTEHLLYSLCSKSTKWNLVHQNKSFTIWFVPCFLGTCMSCWPDALCWPATPFCSFLYGHHGPFLNYLLMRWGLLSVLVKWQTCQSSNRRGLKCVCHHYRATCLSHLGQKGSLKRLICNAQQL